MIRSLAFVIVIFFALTAAYKSYDGYQVVKAVITSESQAALVNNLNLDVWSGDGIAYVGTANILVSPSQLAELVKLGVQYTVDINNVGDMIAEEKSILDARPPLDFATLNFSAAAPSAFFNAYHTATEIAAYINTLATSFPQLVKYTPSIGTTVEGRSIGALIVTGTATGSKKKIFVQGGQHAREWVGPTTVLLITENLVTLYATDANVKALLDRIEFHIIPLLNVDGYTFSWTQDRLWRKNRKLVTGTTYGVDLNRNWQGVSWCEFGASKAPDSETYCGTAPFSEPETKVSSAFSLANGPYAGAIDYHSYSQLVLRPWGYTTTLPSDEAVLKVVGDGYSAAVRNYSGLIYTSEPSWQLYYTTGTASDYWKGFGTFTKYSYTVELRPTGNPGFVLPPAQIIPTGQENYEAFKYFANVTTL